MFLVDGLLMQGSLEPDRLRAARQVQLLDTALARLAPLGGNGAGRRRPISTGSSSDCSPGPALAPPHDDPTASEAHHR